MSPYKTSATISRQQDLTLTNLPFEAGATVEVILKPVDAETPSRQQYPLRGLPVRYEDPFEPVALDDWSALR